jgi:hypothetical protein
MWDKEEKRFSEGEYERERERERESKFHAKSGVNQDKS